MSSIAVIDYGIGNVRSISNALRSTGVEAVLTNDKDFIAGSSGLVLPGVGAFGAGMSHLAERGLIDPILDFAHSGRPLIAICLGMQMLFDESEEFGVTKGLGLIEGRVRKIPLPDGTEKLPHIGWNNVHEPVPGRWQQTLLSGTSDGTEFYFVHSFCGEPTKPQEVIGETGYGDIRFCSAVCRGNIYGFQFHPEKSGDSGLTIMRQFAQLCS